MPRGSRSSTDYQIEIPVTIKDQTAAGAKSVNSSADKMAQQAQRDAEKAARSEQTAVESLQRQRSSALIAQGRAEESAAKRLADAKIKEAERGAKEGQKAQEKAARDAAATQLKIEKDQSRAVESLQRQRSSALLAAKRKEEQDFARSEANKLKTAQQAAADYEASQTAMWGRIQNIAIAAALAIAGAIVALWTAIDRAATFQRLEQGLAAMMGSAEAAKEEIIKLKEVAKVPGLGFREAIQGSLSLQALGFDAERARKVLIAFGNAVAFTGGKAELNRIIIQLSQMAAAGKVVMQDLRPIIQTAPVAARALKEVFGTIDPKELNKKTKDVGEFIDQWVAGLMKLPQAPNAAANAFENLGDSWDRFLVSIGKPFLPLVSDAINTLAPLLEQIGRLVGSLLSTILAYPGPLALATAAVTAFGLALLFASTNAIPLIIAQVTSTIQVMISLAGTLRLVGQVMVGTASLIQGAATTTAVFTAGWVAVILILAAVVYALSQTESAAEKADKVTLDMVASQQEAYQSSLALAEAGKAVAQAQLGSTQRHEELNAILGQLDPVTQAYIRALTDEKDQVVVLNSELDKHVELNRGKLQANLIVTSAAIVEQTAALKENVEQQTYAAENIRDYRQKLIANGDTLGGYSALIRGSSENTVRLSLAQVDLNKSLSENQAKFLQSAKALNMTTAEMETFLKTAGYSTDQIKLLTDMYNALTPAVNDTNQALAQQAIQLKDVSDQLKGLLNTGALEMETKILEITKSAKNAAEARKMAQDALKNDQTLKDLLQKRRTYTEVEKAAKDVFEPKPISKSTLERGKRDQEMISSMKTVADELSTDFKEEFGKAMKFHFGQTGLHTKLNYDHRAAFDISEDPASAEGRFVMEWLQSKGINFRASMGPETSRITGKTISTGRHIHAGELSGAIGRGLKINEGLLSPTGLQKALEKEALVFDTATGEMIRQEELDKRGAQRSKAARAVEPISTSDSALAELPVDLQKKWDLYYDDVSKKEAALADRRKFFAAEESATQKNLITEIGNVQLDLDHLRAQNADDQFSEQRRLLSAKQEEFQLTKSITAAQDEQANGPLNSSLRIQLALLQDINAIRTKDEQAIKEYNRAQLEMADATVYHAAQADTAVAKFLAQQKSVTEIVSDAKIGVIQTTFDIMDRGLSKLTDKLGIMKNLVHDLLSSFLRLALTQFFKTVFLGQGSSPSSSQAQGGTSAGFSIGGLFKNLVQGVFNPGGGAGGAGGPTGTPSWNPSASGGSSAPPSLTAAPKIWGDFAKLLPGSIPDNTVKSALNPTSAAGGMLASLGKMAPLLGPLLGVQLGSSLGGGSGLGRILGGIGGGLLGGAIGIGAGLFTGALSMATWGPILGVLGPVAAAAFIPLIAAAIILGKKAQRDKAEKERATLSTDVYTATIQILNDTRVGKYTKSEALAAFDKVGTDYLARVAQMKDSKTRRIASDWWFNDFKPVYRPLIETAGTQSDSAATRRARMVPVFAGGGTSYLSQMIKVRPGEGIQYPGTDTVMPIQGLDLGYDSRLMFAPKGTKIIPQQEMQSPRPMQRGGTVGESGGGSRVLQIDSLEFNMDENGLATIVINSPHFEKAVVRNVKVGKARKKLR